MSRRAVPGSDERPDGEFAIDTDPQVKPELPPGVYIVTQRPSSLSAKLLPPLFLIVVATGFLLYRTAAADWRGVSALVDWFQPTTNQIQAKPEPTSVPSPAFAQNTEPANPAEPTPEPRKAEPSPKVEVDPLADIQREAEKEQARIADLEKHKAREEEKLAATENERREEQQEEKFGRVNEMQRQFMRRHQQMFEQMQRQQMEAMRDMRERFLGRGMGNAGRLPMLPGPGFGFDMAPPLPGNGDDGEEVVRKTPDGGETRFRQFKGPNGSGFVWQFRGGNGNNLVPAPPKPRLRDDNEPAPQKPAPPAPWNRRFD